MSVYLRKGSPFYQYEFVIDGKRFRGSCGTSNRREAEAEEKRIRATERERVASGVYTEPAQRTVDYVAGRYVTSEAPALSWAEAVVEYVGRVVAHLGPDTPYSTVSAADVQGFVDKWVAWSKPLKAGGERKLSGATINRMLQVWQQLHNFADRKLELPVKRIAWSDFRRKEPKERVRHLTVEQARALLGRLPKNVAEIVGFALASGCRKNEIVTLTGDRVNMHDQVAEVLTKGGGTRFVNLSPSAMAILSGKTLEPGVRVFDAKGLRGQFEAACAELGIHDFHFHDLRHTHATWLGRAGASVQIIQRALGHTQITTTMRYAHVVNQDVKQAVGQIPQLGETGVDRRKKHGSDG